MSLYIQQFRNLQTKYHSEEQSTQLLKCFETIHLLTTAGPFHTQRLSSSEAREDRQVWPKINFRLLRHERIYLVLTNVDFVTFRPFMKWAVRGGGWFFSKTCGCSKHRITSVPFGEAHHTSVLRMLWSWKRPLMWRRLERVRGRAIQEVCNGIHKGRHLLATPQFLVTMRQQRILLSSIGARIQ